MKRDIIKVVEGVSKQEELHSSEWRFVSCAEVREGGRLREEVIQLLSGRKEAEGTAYKLEDGKIFKNLDYNVVDVSDDDDTQSEIEFALMTEHTAVKLKIFRAKDLNEVDNLGSCNPFVVIWLINRYCRPPHGYKRTDYNSLTKREKEEFIVFQQETTVKMKTANPEWNEEFYIYICPSDEILLLDVYAWNEGRKNKCLGRAVAEDLCGTDRGRMDQSWENPLEFELTEIVGTIAFHGKPSKLFVGYNHVDNYSEGIANANDATEVEPVKDSVTDLMPQTSSNGADSGVFELISENPTIDQHESESIIEAQNPQSPDNRETPKPPPRRHHTLPHNNAVPQSSDSNETPQTVDHVATLQSHDNNETHGNESRNNDNLDSSYYSWQNIMQRFKDLPFDEPNLKIIQREIAEFYRRSMRNAGEMGQPELAPGAVGGSENGVSGAVGGEENNVSGAVGREENNVSGAVGREENNVSGAVGGTESCAPKASKVASNMIPSFEKVGLNHEGRMATVDEVRANFSQVRGLLGKWTIALLDGGKLCGIGYGSKVEEGDFNHQAGSIIGEKIIVLYRNSVL